MSRLDHSLILYSVLVGLFAMVLVRSFIVLCFGV